MNPSLLAYANVGSGLLPNADWISGKSLPCMFASRSGICTDKDLVSHTRRLPMTVNLQKHQHFNMQTFGS